MNTFYLRHKGPYILCVTRPHPTKKGVLTSEWLSGSIDEGEEVEQEARTLMPDARDTISSVGVWSDSEGQFVTLFNKVS